MVSILKNKTVQAYSTYEDIANLAVIMRFVVHVSVSL